MKEEAQKIFDWWKSGQIKQDDDRLLRLAFIMGFPAAIRGGTRVKLCKRDLDGYTVKIMEERATAVFEIAYILSRLPDHDRPHIISAIASLLEAETKCRGVMQSYLDGVRMPKSKE